ncbi:MAG: ATP-dependent Clp protease proteolytic subunit [Bifidobacteriaceae bacterium]|nr:ATP-dependent Clp protease proteolytic subunit [Bifidobacteriaceae bacterium]
MNEEEEEKPKMPLQEQVFAKLLKQRIIWLGSEVNDEVANLISSQMMILAAEDPDKDIWLYINSPGGSITAGMVIYDTMQFIKPDVATVAFGLAASMGQFLLSSGAKGKRYATPHARILMHQPSGGVGGTQTDVRIHAELILHMKKVLSEITAEQTGKSIEQIYEDNEQDNWFTAQEALEYGFIDKVADKSELTLGNGGLDK